MTEQELFEYVWVPAVGCIMGIFSDILQINPSARTIYNALITNNDPGMVQKAARRLRNILTQENKGMLITDITGILDNRTLEDDLNILAMCVPGKPNSTDLQMSVKTSNHDYGLYANTVTCIYKFISRCFDSTGDYIILDDICMTEFEARALLTAAQDLQWAIQIKLSNGKQVYQFSDLPDGLFDSTGLLNTSALNIGNKKQSAKASSNIPSNTSTSKWKSMGSLKQRVMTFANNGNKEDLQSDKVCFLALKQSNGQVPNRTSNRLNIRPLSSSGLPSSTPQRLYLNSAKDYNCFTCFIINPDTSNKADANKLVDYCAQKFKVNQNDLAFWIVKPKTNGYFRVKTEAGVDVYIEASSLNEALERQGSTENINFVESIVDSNDTDWIDYVQRTMD